MLKFALLIASSAAAYEAGHFGHHDHLAHGLVERQTDETVSARLMSEIQSNYTAATQKRVQELGGECTWEKMVVRREWSELSEDEKKAYLEALKCMQTLPSKTNATLAPGARNRVDDFAAAHVVNLQRVHFSPWLLPWHRRFTWEWERALKEECDWTGGQPYWDWSRTATKPLSDNPLFDGSSTSISGNGKVVETAEDGGQCSCITTGPLANWTVNLGPLYNGASCKDNPLPSGLGYNPRCLERDFDESYMENITYPHIVDFILNYQVDAPTSASNSFFTQLESWPNGIHPIPHTVIGGLQNDIPASPSDPFFFFHHAHIDRVWSLWQSRDEATRRNATARPEDYSGTRKYRGWALADTVGMESVISFTDVFENVTVGEVMDPSGGVFCYRYE
ncbi:Di-copper centre-containing [Lecanosticta acicola]|uniref:Di-copper centre-containing n=1 Tax=Lecanosticta acicola TaxID=111012 RepID=A0AAI8W1K5_9PEZI|nr:Di-copper centre-containing [Lecanosticta acicola]